MNQTKFFNKIKSSPKYFTNFQQFSVIITDVAIIEIETEISILTENRMILTENRIESKSQFSCIPSNDLSSSIYFRVSVMIFNQRRKTNVTGSICHQNLPA